MPLLGMVPFFYKVCTMSKSKSKAKANVKKTLDVYDEITNKIILSLEKGVLPWSKPWITQGDNNFNVSSLPYNATTGKCYSGINILCLWMSAFENGFLRNAWLSYKQAEALGGNVRKGERSTLITFTKPWEVDELDSNGKPILDAEGKIVRKKVNILKGFPVFNIEQCENLPSHIDITESIIDTDEAIDSAELILKNCGVSISNHYQDRAFYKPSIDKILLPLKQQFSRLEDYYATALHEIIHATGHPTRLNREGIVKSDNHGPIYAFEELVAELGSAFLLANLGIHGEFQHDSYIASWLKVLREDKKAIFKASYQARCATEYVMEFVTQDSIALAS